MTESTEAETEPPLLFEKANGIAKFTLNRCLFSLFVRRGSDPFWQANCADSRLGIRPERVRFRRISLYFPDGSGKPQ
jgi:hypothetical protein